MDRQLSDDLIIAGNQRTAERAYWLKRFADQFQRGAIPYDVAVRSWKEQALASQTFAVPAPLAARCLRLSNGSPYNLYVILCAAVVVLVSKYTASSDIVIGSPVLNDDSAGKLLNTVIPLRVQAQESMSFRQLLKHVKETHLEGIDHQNWPIELLAAHLGYDGQTAAFPLFDIVVLLENIHITNFFQRSGPNITFSFASGDERIDVAIRYNQLLYEDETIARIFEQFVQLLGQALEHTGERSLADFDTLAPGEYERLVDGINRTEATYPSDQTITDLFAEAVARFPNRVALRCGDSQLTYRELDGRANQLALLLREHGVQPESIVGIYLERSVDMVVAALAALKAGGAYLPLDPHYPPDRVRYMLEDSRAQVVLTDSQLAGRLAHPGSLVLLDQQPRADRAAQDLPRAHHPASLAYIIYTSGTTGNPKGVMIEHRQVVRLLRNSRFQFDFNERDTWTLFHSFCFDFSVWEMYGALLNGGRLIIVPQSATVDVPSFLELISAERVTILNQTPRAFFRLIEEERKREPPQLALRSVIFGGEALQPGRLRQWQQRYPHVRLVNMYGITETTVHVTYKEITPAEIQLDVSNIGRPIPTTSVYLLDRRLKPMSAGMIGEMFVGGAGVGRGYLHNAVLTQQKFIPSPFRAGERLYRTGDLGRWRANGEIEYIGRADQQVKIRGFRIEAGEIEAQIGAFPGITHVAVIPVAHGQDEQALCAYVVIAPGHDIHTRIAALREHLQQQLPAYMLPAFIVPLDELPLTEHGKLNRGALPDPKQLIDPGSRYLAPRTQLEQQLVGVWAEVLGLAADKIGVHDRFFDLGGTSFSVLMLNTRVQALLQRDLSIMSYFHYPTIASFVEHLQGGAAAHAAAAAPEEQSDDESYAVMEAMRRLMEEDS